MTDYRDAENLDPNLKYQIDQIPKFIREKMYGVDVREAIAQGIERTYEDASKNGNANMEVSRARGSFDVLKDRLDDSDDKLSKIDDNKADKNQVFTMDNMGQDIKEAMSGGSVAVVGVGAVDTKNVKQKAITADRTTFIKSLKNIADPSQIDVGYMYNIVNGKVAKVDDSGFSCIKIAVDSNTWYSLNYGNYSDNFSFFCDSEMTNLGRPSDWEKDSRTVVKSPATSAFLVLSSQEMDYTKLVVCGGRRDISSKYSSDYPYNVDKDVEVPNLVIDGSKVNDVVVDYKDVTTKKRPILDISAGYTVFSASATTSLVRNERGSIVWTGNAINGGFRTDYFDSNNDNVIVKIDGEKTNLAKIDVVLIYRNSTGASTYVVQKEITDNDFSDSFVFDANNLKIYKDAVDFALLFRNIDSASGTFEISNYEVVEGTIESLPIYAKTLEETIQKINSELTKIPNKSNNVIKSPNGDPFIISVTNDGQLIAKRAIPKKINISGNSLVNGIVQGSHGSKNFGMCASDSKHDFNYLLQQRLIALDSTATFSQSQLSNIEMAQTESELNAYLESISTDFPSDLDLAVLQIGDNTTSNIDNFEQLFPKFLDWVKSRCPLARVLVVGTWFSVSVGYPAVKQITSDKGLEFVDISGLNLPENRSYSGAIITYDDNETIVAKESWITHPGDKGMESITDLIWESLGF